MTKIFISTGVCCFLLLASTSGYAQSESWEERQELVKTLMDQESQALLQQEGAVVTQTQRDTPRTSGSMRLKALYGVGGHTHVLVEYGGEDYLFLPGQQQANGAFAGHQPLELKEITGSCVELAYAGQEFTRCITPALP